MSASLVQPWPQRRLKVLASVTPSGVDKKSAPDELPVRLCNYMDVYGNERISGDIPFMQASATQSEIARLSLQTGDVVITKDSETPDDIAVPAIVEPSAEGVVCGYHLALLRPNPKRSLGRFLFWALKAPHVARQFSVRAQGVTRFGLTVGALGDVLLPCPPLEQQELIADFLDAATHEIDRLVAENERLLASTRARCASVIEEVILRGLKREAPTRMARIAEWGQIPAHWRETPLMRLTPDDRPIMYGIVLPGPDFPGGVPIVKGGDVSPSRLRLECLKRTSPEIEAGYARSRLRGGDLVYAIRGSIGAVEEVPDELTGANLTQDAARIAMREGVHGKWLLYALRARCVFSQLEAGALGATVKGINIRDLKRACIPVPPLDEQIGAANYLSEALRRDGELISECGRINDLLHEKREALITAAVTGRIGTQPDITRHRVLEVAV